MHNRNLLGVQERAAMGDRMSGANAIADLLNDLIETNLGIVNIYETAVERLENDNYSEFLHDAAEKHRTFAAELSNLVAASSGRPETTASAGSTAKRVWVVLKATFTDGDRPILSEVTQDAEKVLEAYGDAMGAELRDDVREVLNRHMREARMTYEQLMSVSVSYEN
jgi:uncharacterized protein (TIGR02284 family)